MNKYVTLLLLIHIHASFVLANAKQKQSLVEQCTALEDDRPKAAIEMAQQQLQVINQATDAILYGQFLGCLGWSYASADQVQMAKKKAQELYSYALQMSVSEKSVALIRRAGAIKHRIGERISAVKIYEEAMTQAQNLDLEAAQIPLLVNLGVLNSEIEHHEFAIANYYQALDLMKDTDDFSYQAPVLYNLATTLNGQDRHQEALEIYALTVALITEQWPKSRVAQIYYGYGISFAENGNLEKALEYVDKAINSIGDLNNESIFSYVLQVTKANLKTADGAAGDYLELAQQAKAFYLQPVNRDALLGANRPLASLSLLFESLGRPQDALELYRIKDDLERDFQKSFNKEYMVQMQNQLNQSQSKLRSILEDSLAIRTEFEAAAKDHRKKQLLLLGVCAGVLLLAFLVWQQSTKNKLRKLAMTDVLTGLNNRRAIQQWNAETKLPKPPAKRYMWLIDLDKFKVVNDEYDHDVGDRALIQIAQSLRSFENKNRHVCRWGGEEFLMLTDDVSPAEKDAFSAQLLDSISTTEIKSGLADIRLTASIGISEIQGKAPAAWRRALYDADKALYKAKDLGRNCALMATALT